MRGRERIEKRGEGRGERRDLEKDRVGGSQGRKKGEEEKERGIEKELNCRVLCLVEKMELSVCGMSPSAAASRPTSCTHLPLRKERESCLPTYLQSEPSLWARGRYSLGQNTVK